MTSSRLFWACSESSVTSISAPLFRAVSPAMEKG